MNDGRMTLDDFRRAFPVGPDIHLNNAGVAPMSRSALAAVEQVGRWSLEGTLGLSSLFPAYAAARATFARLVGVTTDHVAMMQTCAAALSQVALGLPFRAGAEVVTWEQEYPSNAYPWFEAMRRVGGRVVRVPSEADFRLRSERLIEAINPRTQAVAVSWVQFQTGAVTDLLRVSEACREVGAWLVVDAIQGLGVVPFDLASLGVDIVCGGTHKWLCGPLGHGFIAFAPGLRDEVVPLMHGAMTYGVPEDVPDPERPPRCDALRFEPGAPLAYGAIPAAAAVDDLLAVGIERVHAHALTLARRLAEGVRRAGGSVLSVLDEDDDGVPRSPIVTVVPRGDLEGCARRLTDARVTFARRAGGFRFAPHGFNLTDEIDAVLALL